MSLPPVHEDWILNQFYTTLPRLPLPPRAPILKLNRTFSKSLFYLTKPLIKCQFNVFYWPVICHERKHVNTNSTYRSHIIIKSFFHFYLLTARSASHRYKSFQFFIYSWPSNPPTFVSPCVCSALTKVCPLQKPFLFLPDTLLRSQAAWFSKNYNSLLSLYYENNVLLLQGVYLFIYLLFFFSLSFIQILSIKGRYMKKVKCLVDKSEMQKLFYKKEISFIHELSKPWWTQTGSVTSCQAFQWNTELQAKANVLSGTCSHIFISL